MVTALLAGATMGVSTWAGRRYSLGWDGSWILWAASELLLVMAIVFELAMDAKTSQLRNDLQRRGIVERLGRLDPGAPLGQIASAICAELIQLPLVDCAGLVRLDDPGRVTPAMAGSQSDGACREVAGAPLPRLRARDLKARAAAGAFVEVLDPDDEGDVRVQRYLAGLRDAGVRAMAHAPIVVGKRVSGVISVCRSVGSNAQAAKDLNRILPILTDVAAIAAMLLAPTVRDARASARTRREFETIMERWWSKLIHLRIGLNVGLRTVPNHVV